MSEYSSTVFHSDEHMTVYIDRSREEHRRTEYRVRVLIDGKFDRMSGPHTKERARLLARQWVYGADPQPTVPQQVSDAGRILRSARKHTDGTGPLFEETR